MHGGVYPYLPMAQLSHDQSNFGGSSLFENGTLILKIIYE